jgi:hypothetical protein
MQSMLKEQRNKSKALFDVYAGNNLPAKLRNSINQTSGANIENT